jgi:hypothetical protein
MCLEQVLRAVGEGVADTGSTSGGPQDDVGPVLIELFVEVGDPLVLPAFGSIEDSTDALLVVEFGQRRAGADQGRWWPLLRVASGRPGPALLSMSTTAIDAVPSCDHFCDQTPLRAAFWPDRNAVTSHNANKKSSGGRTRTLVRPMLGRPGRSRIG